MSLHRKAVVTDSTEVYYPETDGKPMAETDVHRDLMNDLIQELKDHFRARPDVYVSGNLLVYYVEGEPKKCFAPDVFVVKGVGGHERRIYKLWEEGRAPEVVFEITSRGTYREDWQKKWHLYANLGVREYYIYDPEYDSLPDGLFAYRLGDDEFVEADMTEGRIFSPALGLELVDTGETLRLRDPESGDFLMRRRELANARRDAEAALRLSETARRDADAALDEAETRLREEVARAERLAARLRELGVESE